MFYTSIEKTIQILKKDPDYQLDTSLRGALLWQMIFYRLKSLGRGIFYRLVLGDSKGQLFIGAHVRLLYPQLIKMGRSTIIEDNVIIDSLSEQGVILGDNVTIAKFTTIQCTGVARCLGIGLVVGSNSAIGAYSFIGAQGGIRIGDNVIMGPKVSMHAENHNFAQVDLPIRLQGENRKGIQIDDDCWIGAGSIILDGVHIGRGCVVAAGSVVTKSIPAYSVVAGVPSKVIKSRLQSSTGLHVQ